MNDGEVLLAATVEVDLGVAASRAGSRDPNDRVRRCLLRHHPEGLAAIDRAEPGAALGTRTGRTADEDTTLNVDCDIGFADRVDRVHHAGDLKADPGA